jgi:lysyl-tRNA synthetase class 2
MADEERSAAENPEVAPDDDPFVVRRAKLDAMRAAGEQPYRDNWDVTARAAQLEADYADLEPGAETEDVVSVAGRLVAKRDQGKLVFLVIRDASGDRPLFTRVNLVGEEAFEAIKDLDLGDWIGATGTVMRTRRGELSVAPTQITLLSKSLRPLPEKYHGLSDTETRYRQRYVDLIASEVSAKATTNSGTASPRRSCAETLAASAPRFT